MNDSCFKIFRCTRPRVLLLGTTKIKSKIENAILFLSKVFIPNVICATSLGYGGNLLKYRSDLVCFWKTVKT